MKKSFFCRTGRTLAMVFAAASMSAVGYSQTVTVSATQTANGTTIFNNLQDAINSFATTGTNGSNPAANVINVRADQGAITGKVIATRSDASITPPTNMVINQDVTIQGVDSNNNPSLAVFATSFVTNTEQNLRNNAFPAFIWNQAVNLTIKNIAFIPKDKSALTDPAATAHSFLFLRGHAAAGVNTTVNIENCVFTSNNGSDQPITTTGSEADDSKLSDPGVISMNRSSCAIWSFSRGERGDLTLNLKNSVFASITQYYGSTPRIDVIKTWVSGSGLNKITNNVNILEGTVFANIDGSAVQAAWGTKVVVEGTAAKPVIFRKFTLPTTLGVIWNYFANDSDQQPVASEINYARFYDLKLPAVTEGGVVGTRTRAWINHIKNSVIANSEEDGVVFGSGTNFDETGVAKPEVTIENTVFHATGSGTSPGNIYVAGTMARPINITNSYFTDNDASTYAVSYFGTSQVNITNSVVSLNGPSTLAGAATGTNAANVITDPTVTNNEVTYLNTTDVFSPDFFKVQGSDVRDWSVY